MFKNKLIKELLVYFTRPESKMTGAGKVMFRVKFSPLFIHKQIDSELTENVA